MHNLCHEAEASISGIWASDLIHLRAQKMRYPQWKASARSGLFKRRRSFLDDAASFLLPRVAPPRLDYGFSSGRISELCVSCFLSIAFEMAKVEMGC
nr:hypothetical protein Iba_chr02bCG5210 [Ipomoea batatas]